MGYVSFPWITICSWLAPAVQTVMDNPLIRLVNVATFTKETTMSQKAHQNPDPKHTPTSEHKRHKPPITDASPDDPVGVMPEDTGKPPVTVPSTPV